MERGPLNCEAPAVRASVRTEIVNVLAHWMLRTVTSLTEITTPLPAPLVIATSSAGPGTVPPLQLDPFAQETPSHPTSPGLRLSEAGYALRQQNHRRQKTVVQFHI